MSAAEVIQHFGARPQASLKELAQQEPVVMVNLMRFHPRSLDGDGSGWEAYLRYSALTVPLSVRRQAASAVMPE